MSIMVHRAGIATGVLSAASALCVVPSAHALDFKISGQINRAVIAADNGKSSDAGFVDNGSSPTRFAFKGSQAVNPSLKVGFDYEIGLFVNKSGTYNINQGATGTSTDNRQANVFFEGDFGKLTFGKTDGAANSTSKVDFSGLTDLGGGSVIDDYFGGLTFLANDGSTGPALSKVYSNFDALSRVNTIRYDTPSFGGLTVSASYDQGQAIEIAPRFKKTFNNGVKFAAALDYVDSGQRNQDVLPNGDYNSGTNSRSQFKEFGGSASILLPSGLNAFVQYKRRKYRHAFYANGNSIDYAQSYSGGLGYIHGKNHVQVLFGQTDNLYNANSQARNYGIAYGYDLLKSVNLYASYHHITASNLDLTGGGARNLDVVFTGVRVKFF